MAKNTKTELRKSVIYSIFVRNFTEEGTLLAVVPELDRIKELGVDTIWFLPIYPLGEVNRKGVDGSPYAIKDYRSVDPNYGTMEDFKKLVAEIHDRDMKVMIDIVFNHTSPDSILAQEHPEWFYRTPEGKFGNRVGDWTDIIDLDFNQPDLWAYLIDTLKQWAEIVDGFRCDVAPLVPIEFWLEAREAVEEISPGHIWLSESVELSFIRHLRSEGVLAQSDGEIYQAFDMTYDYDVRAEYDLYLQGEISLSQYIYRLNLQEPIFPDNYVKLRNLENHDQPRAKDIIPHPTDLRQWTAFMFLQKGATLIYNGQEVMADHLPSLFDRDTINWNTEYDMSDYMRKLADIQKNLIPMDAPYKLEANNQFETVTLTYESPAENFYGVVNLKEKQGEVAVKIPDGTYENLINGDEIKIINGNVNLKHTPFAITSLY